MADHHNDDIVVLKEPAKRTIIINQHTPTLWLQIIKEIKPFIRCHTECFGEISQGRTVGRQIQPSTPVPLSSPDHDDAHSCSIFPLLKLPVELVLGILEWVVGGYDLRAYLPAFPSFPTLLIFERPRTWKSIGIFQICKAIRQLAIRLYGNPHQHALPFNPYMDKLVIYQSIDSYDARMLVGDRERSPNWRWPYREPYEITGTCHCFNWGLWTSQAYSNTYAEAKQQTNEFVRRIRRMDISILTVPMIGSSTIEWGFRPWKLIFHCLSTILPSVEDLEITVDHYDSCIGEDMKHPSPNLYRYRDMSFFDGIRFAATTGVPNHFFHDEIINPNFFPHLSQLRIVRSRNKCGRVMNPRYAGPGAEIIFGNWAYDAGDEDKWNWEKIHDEL
ncbi:hypothetical protein F5B19DRAFT_163111 [Rostrohypoxylon terebratum]|nr:hypothetical protein F5B19DRAFT_163111 [Rostrohypoxylon terebratum]